MLFLGFEKSKIQIVSDRGGADRLFELSGSCKLQVLLN